MKLFSLFKKKNKEENLRGKRTIGEYLDDMERPSLVVPVPIKVNSMEEVQGFVENALSQIDIANKAVEDAKDEYEAVTVAPHAGAWIEINM